MAKSKGRVKKMLTGKHPKMFTTEPLSPIYGTIDNYGVDGFGFAESDRIFRKMRAASNAWRGMQYFEGHIPMSVRAELEKAGRLDDFKSITKHILHHKHRLSFKKIGW